jgi:1,4-alpha-glucan branching enzyme
MISRATMKHAGGPRTLAEAPDANAGLGRPVSIYQVHPGSWMRVPEENCRELNAAELAPQLADYARGMNFSHVELLREPDSRCLAKPRDLSLLVGHLHQNSIGVILDQASSFLPEPRANGSFAGAPGKKNHADGVCTGHAVLMNAGGAGLELKPDVDWSRDTLDYFGKDPLYRKFYHHLLFSRLNNGASDNSILPLSNREVTAGKASLLGKMPGDEWRKFANLRLLYACMYAQPGKKLLFMGGEFGQWIEWNPGASLDWHLVQPGNHHARLQHWVADLNLLYHSEPALHPTGDDSRGFQWVDGSDREMSTFSWLRTDAATGAVILAVLNCTPVPRHNHRIGIPTGGWWREIINSDAVEYGGSGQGNLGGVEASPFGWNGQSHSLTVTLPPLGAVFFKETE